MNIYNYITYIHLGVCECVSEETHTTDVMLNLIVSFERSNFLAQRNIYSQADSKIESVYVCSGLFVDRQFLQFTIWIGTVN